MNPNEPEENKSQQNELKASLSPDAQPTKPITKFGKDPTATERIHADGNPIFPHGMKKRSKRLRKGIDSDKEAINQENLSLQSRFSWRIKGEHRQQEKGISLAFGSGLSRPSYFAPVFLPFDLKPSDRRASDIPLHYVYLCLFHFDYV